MLLDRILAQWRRPVASSEALDLIHWAMHTVTYQHVAMVIKMARKVGVFVHHIFCCLCTWWPLGQYGASSHPIAMSSGFRSSHRHAALGDAFCIAPVDRHGN